MLQKVLVKYLNPINKNQAKRRRADKEFANQGNFKVVTFPVHEKNYAKTGKTKLYLIMKKKKKKQYRIYIFP